MKRKDMFDIVVKAIGLIALLQGAMSLLDGIMIISDLANVSHSTPKYWAIRGAAQAFVGLCLLRGSRRVVDFAFPDFPQTDQPEPADRANATEPPPGTSVGNSDAKEGRRSVS